MQRGELIVSFLHRNYNVNNGGTEKCVKELSEVFQKDGYSHLCFFAFPKQKSITGKDIVGINYNDKFVGIIKSTSMAETIQYYINSKNLALNCFHVQHLKYHNMDDVLSTICSFNAKVYLFLHDFYFICNSVHLINSDGKFCGTGKPSSSKCKGCEFLSSQQAHTRSIHSFFETLGDRIELIICPSNYVKEVFLLSFPDKSKKICVRPHLVFQGEKKIRSTVDTVKLGFSGRKKEQKGYNHWLKIADYITEHPDGMYELYYLGMDSEDDSRVKNIYVSTVAQGNSAMTDAIEQNGITCAFVWPQCPETYSFVYYELLMSGVYVITNEDSGNIRDEVISHGNGKVFRTVEECIQWLSRPDKAKEDIETYRRTCTVPQQCMANPDISFLTDHDARTPGSASAAGKIKILPVSSLLYEYKFRQYALKTGNQV